MEQIRKGLEKAEGEPRRKATTRWERTQSAGEPRRENESEAGTGRAGTGSIPGEAPEEGRANRVDSGRRRTRRRSPVRRPLPAVFWRGRRR